MPLSPIEVLRKVPLFAGLGEADLAAFAELTRERSYPKGSVIVFEDDPGRRPVPGRGRPGEGRASSPRTAGR